jgi:hypothetical protein
VVQDWGHCPIGGELSGSYQSNEESFFCCPCSTGSTNLTEDFMVACLSGQLLASCTTWSYDLLLELQDLFERCQSDVDKDTFENARKKGIPSNSS